MKTVNAAFQQLSQNQKRLAELFNTNLRAINTAFEMTDAWLHVHRRILNDKLKGTVATCENASDGVDYVWYFKQYNAVRGVIDGISKLKENYLNGPVDAPVEAPPEEKSEEFEFGGDYAH